MRRFLIPLLAASMLVPAAAIAQDRDFDPRDRDRSERSERSERGDRPQRAERQGRSERSDRPARVERVQRVDRAERQPRLERRIDRNEPVRRVERDRRTARTADRLRGGPRAPARRQADRDAVGTRRDRDERRRRLVADGSRVDRDGDGRRDWRRDRDGDGRRDWRRDRDGDSRRDWRRDRDGDRRWSRNWRRDDRYNWHSYRNRYGSLFRLGRYYDPYGYRYRRFTIGFNLWPNYYRSRYWLNDPWHYRLPPAYGPYRWVRYYDDVLLVDVYTGEVVDVIYNFFW